MKLIGSFICITFLAGVGLAQKYPCLAPNIKEDSAASWVAETSAKGEQKTNKITVGQTLRKLGAECWRGTLVDGRRKPIYFFDLQGCWGNPPADYLEILDRQKEEIRKLKTKYTVIEMACDPGGTPPQSISKVFAFPEAQHE